MSWPSVRDDLVLGAGRIRKRRCRAVIRLLPHDGRGLADEREIIGRPNGIVLVTGPTGSGKTTTLYSALTELNTMEDKLITTEDPVEYQIDGIVQIPIDHDIGVTFPKNPTTLIETERQPFLVHFNMHRHPR